LYEGEIMKADIDTTYTKLTIEVKGFEGDVTRYVSSRNSWDCGADDLTEMFRGLLLSMGFNDATVKEVLGEGDL